MQVPDDARTIPSGGNGHIERRAEDQVDGVADMPDEIRRGSCELKKGSDRIELKRHDPNDARPVSDPDVIIIRSCRTEDDAIMSFRPEQWADRLIFADLDAHHAIRLPPQDQGDSYDAGGPSQEGILVVRVRHDGRRRRAQGESIARAECTEGLYRNRRMFPQLESRIVTDGRSHVRPPLQVGH